MGDISIIPTNFSFSETKSSNSSTTSSPNSSSPYFPLIIYEDSFTKPLLFFQNISHFLIQEKYLGNLLAYRQLYEKILPEAKNCQIKHLFSQFESTAYSIGIMGLQSLTIREKIQQIHPFYKLRYSSAKIDSILFPFLSVTIIVSTTNVNCIVDFLSCPFRFHHSHMQQLIDNIYQEMLQLKLIAKITMIYGFLIDSNYWSLFLEDCQQIQNYFHEVATVVCHGIHMNAEIIRNGGSYPKDIRFYLTHTYHEQRNASSDYVFFLETSHTIQILSSSWMISMIYPLLMIHRTLPIEFSSQLEEKVQSILSSEFGMSYSIDPRAIILFNRDYYYPNLIVLAGSHFQWIKQYQINHQQQLLQSLHPSDDQEHPPSFTTTGTMLTEEQDWKLHSSTFTEHFNNFLLFDLYQTIFGSTVNHQVNFLKSDYQQYYASDFEDYYDQLIFNRRMYLPMMISKYHLSKQHYYLKKLMTIPKEDLLFIIFCHISQGCLPTDIPQEDTADTASTIRSERKVNITRFTQQISLQQVGLERISKMLIGSKLTRSRLNTKSLNYYSPNTQFIRRFPVTESTDEYWKEYSIPFQQRSTAIITAIYGNYETTCKKFAKQTIPSDFYCFIEHSKQNDHHHLLLPNHGWILDTFPYHLMNLYEEFQKNHFDYRNVYHHNFHPFNLAKYYKMQFLKIPILQSYDYIIWVDGTISITQPNLVHYMIQIMNPNHPASSPSPEVATKEREDNEAEPVPKRNQNTERGFHDLQEAFFRQRSILAFEHTLPANLSYEYTEAMKLKRYRFTEYNGHYQPLQPLPEHYEAYLTAGYTNDYWSNILSYFYQQIPSLQKYYQSLEVNLTIPHQKIPSYRRYYGLWVTCFLVFNVRKEILLPQIPSSLSFPRAKGPVTGQRNGEDHSGGSDRGERILLKDFLNDWFEQNQQYTTEDQLSFVFSLFKFSIFPYSFPNILSNEEEIHSSASSPPPPSSSSLSSSSPSSKIEANKAVSSNIINIYGNYEFNNLFVKLEHGK